MKKVMYQAPFSKVKDVLLEKSFLATGGVGDNDYTQEDFDWGEDPTAGGN